MKINLNPAFFSEKEKQFLKTDKFEVSLFNYDSGVEAVRIHTDLWEMIWLPFMGQQIWDFSVQGVSIKMVSPVKTPSRGVPFTETYGAFLLHCGISGMGNPTPQDTHPVHGELPAAPYQHAWIKLNKDCLVLGGTYSYRNTHGICYDFTPEIMLDNTKTWFSVKNTLLNTRKKPMPYQYLAHINLLPGYNDQIISTAVLSRENVKIRENPPVQESDIETYASFYQSFSNQPEKLSIIDESHIYDPEMVLWFKEDTPISDHLCYTLLQKHDQEALFVSYDPKTLDHFIRWIYINSEMKAAGVSLPATSETEGFLKESEKGNIKYLKSGESVDFVYNTGMISGNELQVIRQEL